MESEKRQLIGLLGGSFNPVHIGHTMLASFLAQFTPLSEVWMVLSPRNPLKAHPDKLIDDLLRLRMLEIAANETPGVDLCDIELSMPRPSYTINTLRLLARRYPRKQFRLIIGSDNWRNFDQWRDHEEIIRNYGVVIYPRPGYELGPIYDENVEVVNAPQCQISSSFIRNGIARGKDMNVFLPPGVYRYIKDNNLYTGIKETD